ncbi:MAG TPA: hypothetical protein DCL77_06310, partial [Prolixibacteraceae bacterium]|nr:hypothetical protein [Prolixibacteraceae bacterium]
TAGTYLLAANVPLHESGKESLLNLENTEGHNHYTGNAVDCYSSKDTILTGQSAAEKTAPTQNEHFSVSPELEKIPINFRINSTITYYSFKHFKYDQSKKLFFQAWLKENELQKLSEKTDSLRKSYSLAPDSQKEAIATQIINSEKQIIALNDEIPDMYQKAREEEDRYWLAASPEDINKFQEKIKLYNDSLWQIADKQGKQEALQSEIPDTITLYKPAPKAEEKKAVVPGGIIYKIQIGAFKGKIPEASNKLIKKISVIRKVENYVDDKGLKVYTTGNLRSYSDAERMLSQVKQEGIKNAVINAYQSGKKITVVEAKKLNSEL